VQARKDQLLGYMAHNIPVETFANRVDAPAVIIEGGEITIPVDALAQDQLNTNADPSGQR
jgi:hypothetical protein